MNRIPNTVLIVLAFFAIYVIWGSTYLLNKIAVTELPPFLLASLRFVTAGLLIFGLCKLSGKSLSISRRQLRSTIIAGFLFLTVGNGLVVWALKYVDSGFAALGISAQPLAVLLLMRVVDGKKVRPMSMVGVLFGFVGIYLLVSQSQITNQENSLLGMGMILLAIISWASASLFVGRAELPSNYFVNTGYQMCFGGIFLYIGSLLFGEQWIAPTAWQVSTQISMILLVLFGSIVAFTSFNYLLRKVSPDKVATSTYVNPVIALLLGWYFLNEQISMQSVVAAMVLLTGVYFINSRKRILVLSRFSNRIRHKG